MNFKAIFFLLLLLVVPALAQNDRAENWGERIATGRTFVSTDSTRVSAPVDSLLAASTTLYSDVLTIPGSGTAGVYKVAVVMQDYAAADSVRVQVRLRYNFQQKSENSFRRNFDFPDVPTFGPWQTVIPRALEDVVNVLKISPADSVWWGPANGRQYKIDLIDIHAAGPSQIVLTDYMD